ncbi:hypothetical protein LADH09A_003218 [Micromonospora sp. LAH09]|uniref:hypothetical protein n=1 Tax=Micromonospora cabrerizensis TaxID=2911213 RepID=UPI001EE89193|nr:hypothetical protein [Micromonospora cabrerizensis]MCG5469310.1 hypothetical protein [Micromonospora cabrerizensis]
MKRRSVLAACVLSAALVVTASPAPAQAADLLRVNGAYSSSASDRGRLFVSITSTQPVAEIRAELVTEDTGAPVIQTSDFVLDSETSDATTWATSTPLILDELGDYEVHVEVTDVEGNHVRQERAGWLQYRVVPFLEGVTVDRTAIDYDHREVTVRGVLKGRWPGTGEVRPLADFPVEINAAYNFPAVQTTADGSFTGTVTLYAYGLAEKSEVVVRYSPDRLHFEYSDEARFELPINPRQTRVTAAVERTRVVAGETVRVSGQLSWLTPSGWAPLPNQVFAILFILCDDNGCYNQYGPANTDAKGRFALDLAPSQTGYLHASYWPNDPFIDDSATRTKVITVVPAETRR